MKICIFTASRSEYGLLKGLIKKIHLIKNAKLSLVVSGSHLSTKYGLSINEIKKDKFKINKKIYINLEKDSNWDVANAFAETSKKINKYFKSKKFDLVILLGDRYEALSVAISSYINRFPIAHIHGGEKTFNSLDDNFRHSISKLSTFHFVSHISNKKRLIQLGEDKKKIFVVGGLGSNQIHDIKLYNKKKLEKELGINLGSKTVIINIYNEIYNTNRVTNALLNLFKIIKKHNQIMFIFTLPSHDVNSNLLKRKILSFKKNTSNCKVFANLGIKKYYSLLKYSSLVIGNSSSGILEVPSFGIYTINIGTRQRGRIFSKSIVLSNYNDIGLERKILKYIKIKHKFKNPYYKKDTYEKIVNIIKSVAKKPLLYKEFIDLKNI